MGPDSTHWRVLPPEDPTAAPSPAGAATSVTSTGRYEWQEELARGGMGAVLLVRDRWLNRTLAIKVLLDEHRDRPDMVQRFHEEAQITGQLQHPGIVPVHEVGTLVDGRPYFAMKLVKGQTLAELLGVRASPTEGQARFLAIFGQVCQAMAYAHNKRVIHRDLKPANVMVGAFGEVQVMDWGLAKVVGGQSPERPAEAPAASVIETIRTGDEAMQSRAGSVMGTYGYMAPEQARGEVDRLDERTDVFGLGAVLCEVLTGRPPYAGATAGELKARAMLADLGPAQAALLACGAEEELVQLALRCLAAAPEERPADAGAVAAAVAAHQACVEERLRLAEKERAVAEAQTQASTQARALAEEAARQANRAKRLVIGMVALAALAMGGVFVLLVLVSERRLGEQRIEAGVEKDLKMAEAECNDDRDGKEANWHHAEWAIYSAVSQLQYHPNAPAALRERLRVLGEAVEQGKRQQQADNRLVKDLDNARMERGLFSLAGDVDVRRESARYQEAFARYGLRPDRGPRQEAVQRLRTRPIALEVATHLIEWLLLLAEAPSLANFALREQLTGISVEMLRDHPHPSLPALGRDIIAGRDALRRRSAAADVLSLPPEMLRVVGAVLVSYEERGAAIALLRRAVRAYPDDVWLRRDLGGLLLAAAATRQEAKEHYEAALALRPQASGVWVALTAFPLLAGRTGEAVEVAERAVRLTPQWVLARLNLAATLLSDNRPREAIPHLRQAARQVPEEFEPPFLLCQALASLGEWREAAEAARQAIRLHQPGRGSKLLTVSLSSSGGLPWAPAAGKAKLSSLGLVYRKLAVAESNLGRAAEALTAAREVVRLDPLEPVGHAFLGALLGLTSEHREEALHHLEHAVCLGHQSGECLANLCKLRVDLGHHERAVDAGEAAVEAAPASLQAWLNLGVAAYHADRLARAAEALGRYLHAHPDGGGLHVARADCLNRLGRPGEALRHFQAACQQLPAGAVRQVAQREVNRLRGVVTLSGR